MAILSVFFSILDHSALRSWGRRRHISGLMVGSGVDEKERRTGDENDADSGQDGEENHQDNVIDATSTVSIGVVVVIVVVVIIDAAKAGRQQTLGNRHKDNAGGPDGYAIAQWRV